MSIKDRYYICSLDSRAIQKIVISNHYLHRKCQCSYGFGLYDRTQKEDMFSHKLVGVIAYGLPASHNVCKGICGEEFYKEVIELTRLWIDDAVGKNAESFLIGNTIKLVPKKIIVSYSEPDFGHVGTVYQATNWIYTGLTAKRTNRVAIDGSTKKHNRHECKKKGKHNISR